MLGENKKQRNLFKLEVSGEAFRKQLLFEKCFQRQAKWDISEKEQSISRDTKRGRS